MVHSFARRLALACAVAIAAAAGGAAAVSADTPISHSGQYGRHFLADSQEYPGAICHYNGSQNLDRIRVIDPFMFALSNDLDARGVSWRFVVQKRVGSGAWTQVGRSATQFQEASTGTPAAFSPVNLAVAGHGAAIYRALVKMQWWVGGKSVNVVGGATHRVDWYHYPLADANHGFCPSQIL